MNLTNTVKLMVFLNGVTMESDGGITIEYNVTMSCSIVNSNSYQVTFGTGNLTRITAVKYSRIIFD